MIQSFNHTE